MGCFMCPVISVNTLKSNVVSGVLPPLSIQVRENLEDLRVNGDRILSPRTGNRGAISLESRKKYWEKLKPLFPELKEWGWIDNIQIAEVERLLHLRTYPPTYPDDWVVAQERELSIINGS